MSVVSCINANDTFDITNEEIAELTLVSSSDDAATFATSTPLDRSSGVRRRGLLKGYSNTV